jgi:hypothetical protein
MKRLFLGGAVLASLLAISSTAAAGLVVSESFETPALPSPAQQYSADEDGFDQNTTGPASAPNVTFSGFSGVITNDFTTNGSGSLTPGGSNAFPDTTFGNQVAFLQSFQGNNGDIDWAITGLHPGQQYVLSFEDVSSLIIGATPFSVSAFGAAPVGYLPGASFTTETLDFTPSTANGSIDFIGGVESDNTLSAIDNLTISTASVPEPATWAMMLVGFGGLGAAMRSHRKRAATA